MSPLERQEHVKGGNITADFSQSKFFNDAYDRGVVTGVEPASNQVSELWSNFRATASDDYSWLLQASSNLESSIITSARSKFGSGQSFENLFSRVITSAEKHPLETAGYTIGAIVGGAFAVTTAAALAPLELGVGATLAIAAAGAAALDGGAYLVQKLGHLVLDE